jgi:branched-chain amino acid aminotransferase
MTKRRPKTVTTINGRSVAKREAKISIFDNSLLYAEGLFETFLTVDDRILFLDEHLRRLYRGAKLIDLKIPVTQKTLTAWMFKTIREHPSRMVKLRMTLTGGESARWVGRSGKPQVILSAAPHILPQQQHKLLVSDFRVDQESPFRSIKTISYAINATALKEAVRAKCDDALLLNEKGKVAEATSSNVFWIKRGRMYTPPVSAGCLAGVTREIMFREAPRLGISVMERSESLKGLLTADEILVTSSLKLVVGVGRIIHGESKTSFNPGPITATLKAHFLNTFLSPFN